MVVSYPGYTTAVSQSAFMVQTTQFINIYLYQRDWGKKQKTHFYLVWINKVYLIYLYLKGDNWEQIQCAEHLWNILFKWERLSFLQTIIFKQYRLIIAIMKPVSPTAEQPNWKLKKLILYRTEKCLVRLVPSPTSHLGYLHRMVFYPQPGLFSQMPGRRDNEALF